MNLSTGLSLTLFIYFIKNLILSQYFKCYICVTIILQTWTSCYYYTQFIAKNQYFELIYFKFINFKVTIQTTMSYTHNYTEGKKEIANKIDDIYSPLLQIGWFLSVLFSCIVLNSPYFLDKFWTSKAIFSEILRLPISRKPWYYWLDWLDSN